MSNSELQKQRKDALEAKRIQHMQERNERQRIRMEARAKEREYKMCVDYLVDALSNNLDPNTYAKIIKERGFDYKQCLQTAMEIYKKNMLTKRFTELLEEDVNLKIEDFSLEKMAQDLECSEEFIRSAFASTQVDLYNSILSRECEKDSSTADDMLKLYTLGKATSHKKTEIDNYIKSEREERVRKEAIKLYNDKQNSFVKKYRYVEWILLFVTFVIECFALKWWTFLTEPITLAIILIGYPYITKSIFKRKYGAKPEKK